MEIASIVRRVSRFDSNINRAWRDDPYILCEIVESESPDWTTYSMTFDCVCVCDVITPGSASLPTIFPCMFDLSLGIRKIIPAVSF